MAGPIGTLGTIPYLKVGNLLVTDLDNLIILAGYTTNGNDYSTFVKANASASYTPSGANDFKFIAASLRMKGDVGAYASIAFGHADADGGLANAAPGTVTYFGDENAAGLNFNGGLYVTNGSKWLYEEAGEHYFNKIYGALAPNGSWPIVSCINTQAAMEMHFTAYGYEVP